MSCKYLQIARVPTNRNPHTSPHYCLFLITQRSGLYKPFRNHSPCRAEWHPPRNRPRPILGKCARCQRPGRPRRSQHPRKRPTDPRCRCSRRGRTCTASQSQKGQTSKAIAQRPRRKNRVWSGRCIASAIAVWSMVTSHQVCQGGILLLWRYCSTPLVSASLAMQCNPRLLAWF